MELFSAEGVLLVPGALKLLDRVQELMPAYIISTSYTPYLKALVELTGFPMEHVRCTELSLDAWSMPEDEAAWLREWVERVSARAVISYPDEAMTAAGGHGGGEGSASGGGARADSGVPGAAGWRTPRRSSG